MIGKGSEGLLMRAQPLRAAKEICRRMVDARIVDDAILLCADPAWAGAINTVLVKRGVRVEELRRVDDTQKILKLGVPAPEEGPRRGPHDGCTDLRHVPSFTYWGGVVAFN